MLKNLNRKSYLNHLGEIIAHLCLTLTFFCSSCTSFTTNKVDKFSESTVKKIDGVAVFIMSEPTAPYEKLGNMRFGVYDKLLTLSNKSISQVSADLLVSLSFDKNLSNCVNEVKNKYHDADAVIFDENMSNCLAIKFNR